MKWTNEQYEAITKDNTSIIVSAGAGSGKTAVLTERVIRKIKDGININELLILTFTNKAASEMRERIRKSLKKYPEFKEQLNLLNQSYITTFDSFALSTLKKYNYALNVSKNIKIADSSIIFLKKKKILDEIFENYYNGTDNNFYKLINDFCIKDDDDIKKYILNIYNSLSLLIDKEQYLENYFNDILSEKNINNNIKEYEEVIHNIIEETKNYIDDISDIDYEYYEKINIVFNKLYEATNYDDIVLNLNIRLPNIPKDADEELKKLKEKVSFNIKKITEICEYDSINEIKEDIYLTKDYIKIIIDIIKKMDNYLKAFKKENNIYEFNDISILLIELLKNNKQICDEIRNSYKEIMIDEYQDTSDIQEEFINLISNNNVYMVGDIKQSIYRFRNANPNIFKNKYEKFSKNIGGYKIDLNKNFRSRKEVLDNVNLLFSNLMDSEIGGANYNNGHAMVYGNTAYDNLSGNKNYNMDIINYEYKKEKGFTKEETEIFIIANDILSKIKNKYQVVDKKDFKLRDCNFGDFVILIDRSTNFDLFKKIFEYMKIPLTIYKDEKLNNEVEITVFKNLLKLIIKIKNNQFDNDFKFLFTSIARSFLFEYNDDLIFNYFYNDDFKNNDIFIKCKHISKFIDSFTNSMIVEKIVDEFNFLENFIKLGDVKNRIVRTDYLNDIASNLDNLGFTIYDFSNYLDDLVSNDYDIRFSLSKENPSSCQIMTIHTSKGLEYNICYFPMLYKEFNLRELNEKFIFDKEYGIIAPFFKEGIGKTIYKHLLKNKYINDEISEKIRLFYVALTRAKEKIIFITNFNEDENINKQSFRSFLDMLNYVKNQINAYIQNIDLNNIIMDDNYKYFSKNLNIDLNSDTCEKINVKSINVNNDLEISEKFSINNVNYIDNKEQKNLNIGLYFHYLLEIIDLKKPNLDNYNIDKFYKDKIQNFLSIPILNNIDNCNIFKEYEFIDEYDNIKKHGIIDLMIEHHNYFDIIDYKFSNIDDIHYNDQLIGYKNYIEKKTGKKANIYLYSIMNNQIKNVE